MFSLSDTIVAIATPPGRGGIGVVRVSGAQATRIALAVCRRRGAFIPRRATFVRIPDASGSKAVDRAVVTSFQGPHSYTGEDTIEISGHGSPVLLERIVAMAVDAGARLAEPGEFTFRAYLHGKMDLVQAEAVVDLVEAVTPLQARTAMDQIDGTLTEAIGRADAALFDLVARLEASLDFPDEGFHFVTREATREELARVQEQLDALVRDSRAGRVVREGRTVAIVGRPNAGKSSLFNALAGAARAIVTPIPGTTRDVLTERVDIQGLAVTLLDTAGLREARDPIEAEGVSRARQAQRVAALGIVVLDRSSPRDDEDTRVLAEAPAPRIIVASKADLPRAWDECTLATNGDRDTVVAASAVTGQGVDDVRRAIVRALCERESFRDTPAISNLRHVGLVNDARAAIARSAAVLAEGASEEIVLAEVGAARRSLEEITGRRTTDDVLRHIFSRFCIGK